MVVPAIQVNPFAQVFPFAYLGRFLEYLHGIGDSVFCTVWTHHVKKNRFLISGVFGGSWVRLWVVPAGWYLGVSRVLFLLVACAGVQGRVFNDLLLIN